MLKNSPTRYIQSSLSPPPHHPNSPRSYTTGSEAITAPPPSTDNVKWSLTTRLLPPFQFPSNQARALPHTSQNTHRSNINISKTITVPPPSTVNAKQSVTIRLLPTLQLSRKLLENLQRCTQSSVSLPPQLPKSSSIEHCHFGSNHGAAVATQRFTTVLHNQAIDSTPIFVEIALEATKIHPIKREPSPTPPIIHLDHTLPFRKQSRRRHHPPTTPNDLSPPGYCQHSNFCGNCLKTCEDTSNLVRGPTYYTKTTPPSFLRINLSQIVTTPSSHNAPLLTTLSSCPNPPMTTTHRMFSKEGRDTKLGSPMHPKPA